MPTRKTKTNPAPAVPAVLDDLDLSQLSPDQYEAITKANYYHPETRLILMLFLQVDHLWQLARKMQNKSSSVKEINWTLVEKNSGSLIRDTLAKLLTGVTPQAWTTEPKPAKPAPAPAKKSPPKRKPRLACGCAHHSDAAGVVEACLLGQEQGADERWTGF